jgi:hypothetical protein
MSIYHISTQFINNNYCKWYTNIIGSALAENRKKMRRNTPNYVYYESHHILPISVCPQYSCFKQYPWNKVLLTAKEHLLCHMLLPKFVTDGPVKFKLIHALYAMTQQSNSQQQRPNMRIYSYAKEQMIITGFVNCTS